MPPIISSGTSKVMSMISVHDLMTVCRVLLLIIGQNYLNPRLLQPIVASIYKVMTVKKPCVSTSEPSGGKISSLNFWVFEQKLSCVR